MATPHTTDDSRDSRLVNANLLSDRFLASRSSQGENLFPDILGGVASQTSHIGMFKVLVVGAPFEIGPDIIGFDPIHMVDLGEIVGIGNKFDCHDAMDEDVPFVLGISRQAGFEIAPIARIRLHDLGVESLRAAIAAHDDAAKTSNLPEAADFIEASELCDRNWSPFFRKSDIHVTGCPSGNGGSTIKSPSRASTFGGFAIMAVASDTYNRRLQFL